MYNLKYAALHITKDCSHDCPCCYYKQERKTVGDNHTSAAGDYPLDTLKAVVDECSLNNVEEIFLLGGDPAEYARILELSKYAQEKHIVLTSVSNTHQYKCDPKELAKYLAIYESTIHGATSKEHNTFCRTPGAYEMALDGLSQYHSLGCTTGITVNIMPANANGLHAIVSNIIDVYGRIIEYVNVQRLVPFGRASINDGFYLNRAQVLVALSQIDKINADFDIDIQCEDAFPLCLIPKKYWKYIHKCEWGYEKLSINGDGGVSRCGADPRYNLGNVLETSLAHIWNESKILNEFRAKQFLPRKCQDCWDLSRCGGGCVHGCWSGQEFGPDYLLEDSVKK